MHDPQPMQVRQCPKQLLHNINHQCLRKLFQLLDKFYDRPTPAILHNHIVERFEVIDLI